MKPLSQSVLAVAALALVAASPAPAVAQPAAAAATTTRSQVTIVRIKPDPLVAQVLLHLSRRGTPDCAPHDEGVASRNVEIVDPVAHERSRYLNATRMPN